MPKKTCSPPNSLVKVLLPRENRKPSPSSKTPLQRGYVVGSAVPLAAVDRRWQPPGDAPSAPVGDVRLTVGSLTS